MNMDFCPNNETDETLYSKLIIEPLILKLWDWVCGGGRVVGIRYIQNLKDLTVEV